MDTFDAPIGLEPVLTTSQLATHLPGLQAVIKTLQPVLETPQSIALWLTGVADLAPTTGEATTMWDLLHQGDLKVVLAVAADDLA